MTTEVIHLLVRWLNGNVVGPHGKNVLRHANKTPQYQDRLASLWVLAGRIGLPGLQNDAIDMLEERIGFDKNILTKYFGFVFENTVEGDALRRYIVDICTSTTFSDDIFKYFPEALWQEIDDALGTIHEDDAGIQLGGMKRYHVVAASGSNGGGAELKGKGKETVR